MFKIFVSASIFLPYLAGAAGFAQLRETGSTLALTFAYSPRGAAADLSGGYRKHLEWHKARNDPILWYAWFVVEGDRLGHFIDGAYDVTGAEFDARPDPAGDAADAIENFVPAVEMQYRRIFRLREDLGSSKFLEERHPSPLMQVVYYRVYPGKQVRFEAAAAAIASAARRAGIDYTLYEMLSGARGALYAMYVPLQGFRTFDNPVTSLELIARSMTSSRAMTTALEDLAAATQSTRSEVWQYRSDLSLIPGDS